MAKKKMEIKSIDSVFDKHFGKVGTPKRNKIILKGIIDSYNAELKNILSMDEEGRAAKIADLFKVLKNFRKEAGITQKDLANKLGVKVSYLSRVENGKVDVQLSTLFKIINGLGLTPKISSFDKTK